MANNTSAVLSATLFKQYWNEKFLTELRSKLQLADLGVKGTIPGGQGQIVHWLSMADMSLNTTAATEAKHNGLLKSFLNTLGSLSYLTQLSV